MDLLFMVFSEAIIIPKNYMKIKLIKFNLKIIRTDLNFLLIDPYVFNLRFLKQIPFQQTNIIFKDLCAHVNVFDISQNVYVKTG